MDDTQPAFAALQAEARAAEAAAEQLRKENAELSWANDRLSKEVRELRSRLDFVEDIVGPTETQRKMFQIQLMAAREAAVRVAHSYTNSVPTRCVGRLDERWLRSKGLTPAECTMLQRGCVTGENGVPCDISLLGDPAFSPYDRETFQPNWELQGGFLRLSLGDIRAKWGEEVALEVLRCAIELDRHDASRRLGVELPWHEKEDREMEPSEIIGLLGQQLSKTSHVVGDSADAGEEDEDSEWGGLQRSEMASPEDVGDGNAVSRAWFMLEAMMSDLGLNQMSLLTPPLVTASAESAEHQCNEDEADEDVVAEALEEDHLAELRRQAIAEQDIQQMLHEPEAMTHSSFLTAESSTRQKSGASTPSTGTPVARTRCTGAQSPSLLASSSAGGVEVASSVEGEVELALPHEVSNNEALFLRLLQDDVNTNLSFYLSAGTDSPSSSTDRSVN
eukprot:TRINITY_DN35456_c0_g1_i1.p1 TRINITY_DN35456_c0_g1~~TRINITY_DN35456_c0_g1_i1.p1  ORF type:complete len:448 (+),score=93.12 TRINITY_DN35456_c0_g1_i1:122-1465(+)